MIRTVRVDGEVFQVAERTHEPGVYDIAWASGPNAGYGFTSATYDGQSRSDDELRESIRTFLARVDPVTGYIE